MRKITLIIVFSIALVSGALWVGKSWQAAPVAVPELTSRPPIKSVTFSSTFRVPVVITWPAIRSALESQVPRSTTGRQEDPIPQLLTGAKIDWSVDRGPLDMTERVDAVEISTELAGRLHIAGTMAGLTDDVVGTLGGLINPNLGQGLAQLTGTLMDQYAGFSGWLTVTSRPRLISNWRLEPNLSARASVTQAALSIAGVPFEFRTQLQPMLDSRISEQIAEFQSVIRVSPFIEQAVRRDWRKLCRSIPLPGVSPDLPKLWLELKPVRAFAEQPRIEAAGLKLDIGVQAETRILPNETSPECPFPDQLEMDPRAEQEGIHIAIPIQLPLTDVSKLLEDRLAGKTFPEHPSGPIFITIKQAGLASSGNRLLMSLRVKVRARESWLGFGTEADIKVSGRPVLEPDQRLLRLADIVVDVQSAAAFGLVGEAAEALEPMIRDTLAKEAVINLKPFFAEAKEKITGAIADFSKAESGVKLDSTVDDIRVVDIGFDAQTLRIVAEATGALNVLVSSVAF